MISPIDLATIVAILPPIAFAAWDDNRAHKIRNKYVLAVFAVGCVRLGYIGGAWELWSALLSATIGGCFFYALAYEKDLLGGGDVKMLIALLWTLPYAAYYPYFWSLAGCLILGVVWFWDWHVKVPLAPYFLAANLLCLGYLVLI